MNKTIEQQLQSDCLAPATILWFIILQEKERKELWASRSAEWRWVAWCVQCGL